MTDRIPQLKTLLQLKMQAFVNEQQWDDQKDLNSDRKFESVFDTLKLMENKEVENVPVFQW